MKILYDFQTFALQRFGGISRYFFELVSTQTGSFQPHVAVKYHRNIYLENYIASLKYPVDYYSMLGKSSFAGKGVLIRALKTFSRAKNPEYENKVSVAEMMQRLKPDIFHPVAKACFCLCPQKSGGQIQPTRITGGSLIKMAFYFHLIFKLSFLYAYL